jgi:hypothetical protein
MSRHASRYPEPPGYATYFCFWVPQAFRLGSLSQRNRKGFSPWGMPSSPPHHTCHSERSEEPPHFVFVFAFALPSMSPFPAFLHVIPSEATNLFPNPPTSCQPPKPPNPHKQRAIELAYQLRSIWYNRNRRKTKTSRPKPGFSISAPKESPGRVQHTCNLNKTKVLHLTPMNDIS